MVFNRHEKRSKGPSSQASQFDCPMKFQNPACIRGGNIRGGIFSKNDSTLMGHIQKSRIFQETWLWSFQSSWNWFSFTENCMKKYWKLANWWLIKVESFFLWNTRYKLQYKPTLQMNHVDMPLMDTGQVFPSIYPLEVFHLGAGVRGFFGILWFFFVSSKIKKKM